MTSSPLVAPQGPRTLDSVVRRIHGISTLPDIAMRVMKVAEDPRCGAKELKQAMEVDPAMSARVLQCVNSSAYAVRSKITNLQHAIAYLGIKQIRNIAMTAAVSELFKGEETLGIYKRAALWKHLVAVGICARMIAMRNGRADFEDMFLAGLLHDIGIILEDQYLHAPFGQVINTLRKDAPLTTVEREVLGFDHTALAERIAHDWRFPEAIVATVRYHHQSNRCPTEAVDVVRCVEVANLICSLKGMTSVGMNLVAFPSEAIAALHLTKDDIVVLATDLERELQANENILNV